MNLSIAKNLEQHEIRGVETSPAARQILAPDSRISQTTMLERQKVTIASTKEKPETTQCAVRTNETETPLDRAPVPPKLI